jgi:hypothetical protein
MTYLRMLALGVMAAAMAAGCVETRGPAAAGPVAPAAKPAEGWTVVYTSNFQKPGKPPAEWQVLVGEAKVEGGALLLTGHADEEGQVLLTQPRMPGSVRVEFTASLKGSPISDISPFVNADDTGFLAGYLFQFGGIGNTLDRLHRCGEEVGETVKTAPLVKPGQKYRMMVENDGGRLRMVIDGQEVFRHSDPQPLKGSSADRIGFYTWGCTLAIENVTVYAKGVQGAGK